MAQETGPPLDRRAAARYTNILDEDDRLDGAPEDGEGRGGVGRAGEPRCVPQVEVEVAALLDDELGELPVLLGDKGVVVGGDDEDLEDPVISAENSSLRIP